MFIRLILTVDLEKNKTKKTYIKYLSGLLPKLYLENSAQDILGSLTGKVANKNTNKSFLITYITHQILFTLQIGIYWGNRTPISAKDK